MAAPTERSPLTGLPPQTRRPLAKIAAAVVVTVAAALVVTLTLTCHGTSSVPSPTTLVATSSSAWNCGSPDFDAGYIKLANKKDDYFFYYFAPSTSSDPSQDPLVLWLTGGAGGSSLAALLTENGPCTVSDDGLSTTPNAYSWTQQANVIWLDQPTGVGFSYSTAIDEDADIDNFKVSIGENIYWFLQGFLERHAEFDGRTFFITGESYAGHYIPSAAHFILEANKHSPPPGKRAINLQGVAIGNGMVDPVTQFAHNVDMAESNSYNITLLSDAQIAQMREDTPRCVALTSLCQQTPTPLDSQECADAMSCLNEQLIVPYALSQRNNYDIRKPCTQPTTSGAMTVCGLDFAAAETLLTPPEVRDALHVAPQAEAWVPIRPSVSERFVRAGDFSASYKELVTALLDDGSVRVLVYNGDADLMCNWRGGDAWTRALEWHGKDAFNAAEEHAFVMTEGGDAVGTARASGNFTFLRVFNSGHMVPQDQPAVALEMINRFFRNEPL